MLVAVLKETYDLDGLFDPTLDPCRSDRFFTVKILEVNLHSLDPTEILLKIQFIYSDVFLESLSAVDAKKTLKKITARIFNETSRR